MVWFNSEGGRPSEVTQRLMSMGFKPIQGAYDYVYEWESSVDVEEILRFGDRVQMTLSGLGVLFKLETLDGSRD
ncbi:hypothetical protein FHEFKHOI_00827 [Candidatus Methanoperedenaceae archaeon GB50]|nr:hypothetical protein AIOGIFDO_00824 [Candidatus Methanoperedenaceae archaeon GB37]CAD7770566.1 hypothetical protein FHEFKHOI_00827 [Candidatus Methanoperedenaceae archaeon GB50]CAD7772053.1 MAG: hypothetical protein KBONHNOK_00478 [Candidatus Methanoperedenaceae archaeon GB50]